MMNASAQGPQPSRSRETSELKSHDFSCSQCSSSADAELLHAISEGVGMKAEYLRGAAGAVDHPVGLLKDA